MLGKVLSQVGIMSIWCLVMSLSNCQNCLSPTALGYRGQKICKKWKLIYGTKFTVWILLSNVHAEKLKDLVKVLYI